jgi:hypothetical protein
LADSATKVACGRIYPLRFDEERPLSDNLELEERRDWEEIDDAVETERSRSGQASMASVGDRTKGGDESLSLKGLGIVIDIRFVGVDSELSTGDFAGISREGVSCFGNAVATAEESMSRSATCSLSRFATMTGFDASPSTSMLTKVDSSVVQEHCRSAVVCGRMEKEIWF